MYSPFPHSVVPSRNKGMAIFVVVLFTALYIWVSSQDAMANQYSSCSRLGLSSAPPRSLVLFPQTLLGSAVASALSKAGHSVFVLDEEAEGANADAAATQHRNDYAAQEIVPLRVLGTSRNVSALVEIVQQHGIQHIIDTRPLREEEGAAGDAGVHQLAFARRLAQLHKERTGQGSGVKRTFIYTSGCAMHSLIAGEASEAAQISPQSSSLSALPQDAKPTDFPAHETLRAEHFEHELLQLGRGRSAGLHTLVLRPGVLYGGAAWATSPLRHWFGSSVSTTADSRPFQGVHLDDAVHAFVLLGGSTPASLAALSGEAYDLLDETRVTMAAAAAALKRDVKPVGQPDPAHFSLVNAAGPATDAASPAVAAGARRLARTLLGSTHVHSAASSAPSRCAVPSKSANTRFSAVTHWTPAHRKLNEPERVKAYAAAVRALAQA